MFDELPYLRRQFQRQAFQFSAKPTGLNNNRNYPLLEQYSLIWCDASFMGILRRQRRLQLLSARFARMWRAGGYSDLDEIELKRRAAHLTARLEALARWKRRGSSVVMPNIFIELAESTGRIGEITDCMITKTLSMASQWPCDIDIQINLSPQDLLRHELLNHIQTSLDAAGVNAARVTFEVTETTIMSNERQVLRTIEAIRAMGCKIALDDFGTGYSSLAYIDRFTFDQIKLDREFARKLGEGETSIAVISTVFALSQKLGLECTIEGIETKEQALLARSMGMRRMQGYYFAMPLTQEALLAMLRGPFEEQGQKTA